MNIESTEAIELQRTKNKESIDTLTSYFSDVRQVVLIMTYVIFAVALTLHLLLTNENQTQQTISLVISAMTMFCAWVDRNKSPKSFFDETNMIEGVVFSITSITASMFVVISAVYSQSTFINLPDANSVVAVSTFGCFFISFNLYLYIAFISKLSIKINDYNKTILLINDYATVDDKNPIFTVIHNNSSEDIVIDYLADLNAAGRLPINIEFDILSKGVSKINSVRVSKIMVSLPPG
jgi:hypothetical protein